MIKDQQEDLVQASKSLANLWPMVFCTFEYSLQYIFVFRCMYTCHHSVVERVDGALNGCKFALVFSFCCLLMLHVNISYYGVIRDSGVV